MQLREARQYVGQTCEVCWYDRHGNLNTDLLHVVDVTFIPLYGLCLLTEVRDIRLDRVVSIQPATSHAA